MSVLPVALALLAQAAPVDGPPPGDGPRATSGEQRYDAVGYGQIVAGGDAASVRIATSGLPVGSFAEVTSLDTGRTIVALVDARSGAGAGLADLSPGAARALGLTASRAPIRLRAIVPTPVDQDTLKAGHAASPRIDTPPSLLVALRKRLTPDAAMTSTPAKPAVRKAKPVKAAPTSPTPAPTALPVAPPATATPPAAKPPRAIAHPLYVQVAALSSEARAQALVRELGGGRVISGGNLFRVQLGPFANAAEANRARDAAARRDYAGGHVVPGN